MSAAFTFPEPTGVAQHDGLALLRHVIAHGVTPLDLDACKLALHTAPLAYLGAPEAHTVAAVNGAVDKLSAAVRRLSADLEAQARDKAARLAKVARLFEGFDEPASDSGSGVPLPPTPPAPPTPAAKFEELAANLAKGANIDIEAARRNIRDRVLTLYPNSAIAAHIRSTEQSEAA